MAIDTSGKFWRGTDLSDLAEYVRRFEAGGYAPATMAECVCPQCGGLSFAVCADSSEGCAQLTCRACGTRSFAADSQEYWDDADPEPASCPCGGSTYAAAIGFAMRPSGEVRWVSVGLRCITDGTLAVCADWKIDYGPTDHLLASPLLREGP